MEECSEPDLDDMPLPCMVLKNCMNGSVSSQCSLASTERTTLNTVHQRDAWFAQVISGLLIFRITTQAGHANADYFGCYVQG